MTTYIVDASVVIEYLVTGPYTANARALFTQVKPADRLIVPEFCLLECTNVLWKQVRFQGMTPIQAQSSLRNLRRLPLTRVPVKAVLRTTLIIALKHKLAAYDSAYVALAICLGSPLVTIDRPQSQAATAEGVAVAPITGFI